jgi:hypothetical protein
MATKVPAASETIEQAKLEVTKLLTLLEYPHPGLITWLEAVDNQARVVASIFGYYPPEKHA